MTDPAIVVRDLLDHLPDNMKHVDDESWKWCWDELSGEAQDAVKIARGRALTWLAEHEKEVRA